MIRLAALAATCLLVAACNSRVPVTPSPVVPTSNGAQTSTDAQGYTLPDFTFAPARGGGFSITLPGHGTQGYEWHLVPGFDAAVVSPLNGGANGTASRIGSVPSGGMLGPSAPEIFDFKAGSAGSTRLMFSLYRNGEDPTRGAESRSFAVMVQ